MHSRQELLTLDSSTYYLTAIQRAVYELADKAIMDVSLTESKYIISTLGEETPPVELQVTMLKCITDHMVRLDLEQRYGKIRQLIVEQAIKPVDGESLIEKINTPYDDLL